MTDETVSLEAVDEPYESNWGGDTKTNPPSCCSDPATIHILINLAFGSGRVLSFALVTPAGWLGCLWGGEGRGVVCVCCSGGNGEWALGLWGKTPQLYNSKWYHGSICVTWAYRTGRNQMINTQLFSAVRTCMFCILNVINYSVNVDLFIYPYSTAHQLLHLLRYPVSQHRSDMPSGNCLS